MLRGSTTRKDVVLRYLDAQNHHDRATLREVLTPDARKWFPESVASRGRPNPAEGVDAVIEVLCRGGNYRPGTRTCDVHDLIEEGDRVAARLTVHGVLRGGMPYENGYHLFFRFDGDKIAEVWQQLDTAHAFTELPPVGTDGLPFQSDETWDEVITEPWTSTR
jgi:ketosteroid isomerase-like protein